MTRRRPFATALLAAALAVASAAPAAASMQQTGQLPHGGSYVLDPDPTVGAAAVGLWFRAPGAGYDNAMPGISRIAATAAATAKLAGGKSLYELVHSVGGALNVNVYPDIVGIGAVVPAGATRRVVAAMTAAYFAPSIDAAAVQTAQRDATVLAVQQRYSPALTLHDLLFAELFSGGPAHFPPIPDSVAALRAVRPDDAAAFAKRAFRASNAILTLTGNVDATSIDAVTDGNGTGPMDAPFDSPLAHASGDATEHGAVEGMGLAWTGPPIADERAATAMDFVADYLFRDGTGVVSKAIDAQKSDAYVAGQFITLHDPGVMLVTIDGGDRAALRKSVLDAIAKLQTPLDARTFEAAREAFLYHIAADTQAPAQQADNLGWYAAEGRLGYAPGDAGGDYASTARALDPAYVAETVRRYLTNPVVVNLIATPTPPTGNAS